MLVMETLFNEKIDPTVRSVVYLCDYDYKTKTLIPRESYMFDDWREGLRFYADTPNPPSQIAYGADYESLCLNLAFLHRDMANVEWMAELGECL